MPAVRLYTVSETTTDNFLAYYSAPLDASSTQAASFGIGYANGQNLAVEPSDNVLSSNAGSISEYAVSATALTTVFTVTTGFSNTGIALDASGNLYVADFSGSLYRSSARLSSASRFDLLVKNGLVAPRGICFDGSQNLYVTNGSGALDVFAPPYTSAPLSIVADADGGLDACAFDAATNQLAVTVIDEPTEVEIYDLPLTSASQPAVTLDILGPVAFDRAGDLYANGPQGGIGVFSAPFSTSSTPIFTIPSSNVFSAIALGGT